LKINVSDKGQANFGPMGLHLQQIMKINVLARSYVLDPWANSVIEFFVLFQ
jgi:hypothetical protein